MVVEEASGKPYERAVREAVLEPAGTTGIGYVLPGWAEQDLAVGYEQRRWGTPLDKPWLDDGPSWTLRGNGGMLATAEQLADWFDAVYAGDVIGPESLDKWYGLNGARSPAARTLAKPAATACSTPSRRAGWTAASTSPS